MLTIVIHLYIVAMLFSLIYLLINAYITRRALNEVNIDVTSDQEWPAVSIFKPLKGLDDRLEDNLRSFFELDYSRFEIIFGLHNKKDPAISIVNKLRSEYKNVKAKIIINNREVGLNPKINNLHNMYPHAAYDLLLISDSNTQVDKYYLKQLVAVIKNPETGIVTATVRGLGAKNIASLMENLHINTFITPNVFMASRLVNKPIVIGKSILIKREVLHKIGGFFVFRKYLAEDYLMGNAVKNLGYSVKTINIFVNNINEQWSLKRFFNRHTRWAKMRRHVHPIHYLLESMSNPVAMSFILGILLFNLYGLLQFLLVSGLKLVYDFYVSKLMQSDFKWYHYSLGMIKDLLIGIIWFAPFFSYKVKWRDNRLRITKNSYLKTV